MLYTMIYNTETYNTQTRIFYSYEELFDETCDPALYSYVIDTERGPNGKTYKEKQNNLEAAAIEFSGSLAADHVDPISYSELYELQQYFNKWGRRYGLLTDFKENCIC